MPKGAKGKGGKNRRRGKNDGDEKRELVFKEDGQEYAQVLHLYPTSYTLHLAPYTMHYTLHPTPHTLPPPLATHFPCRASRRLSAAAPSVRGGGVERKDRWEQCACICPQGENLSSMLMLAPG